MTNTNIDTNTENITIAIDHGNRMVKTENFSFASSYIESNYLPSLTSEVINFEGKSYTLADQKMSVLNDKTVDERYFILSLFAIAKELMGDSKLALSFSKPINIDLAIGLPLQHFKAQKKAFEKYFWEKDNPIHFEYTNKKIALNIKSVKAYPQGYSAAISIKDKLKNDGMVNIVDIGGYTVDCLEMLDFVPNMNLCTSLHKGVNLLFNEINNKFRSLAKRELSNKIIEDIIKKEKYTLEYNKDTVNLITDTARTFVVKILDGIEEQGFDLVENKTVFMGGGSMLLEEYILECRKVKKPIFIKDIHCNAKGYKILHDMERAKIDGAK
ncbi:MAG: ParM/StbA family protein [Defluviitaleaceae bacterium]|nr:ParM/StbA family protein [Defluviitaleaceae bacterium]